MNVEWGAQDIFDFLERSYPGGGQRLTVLGLPLYPQVLTPAEDTATVLGSWLRTRHRPGARAHGTQHPGVP